MKRVLLFAILLLLILSELYIATGYLPMRWQTAIDHVIRHDLLRQNPKPLITHPALDEEIQRALQTHPWFEVVIYLFITGLFILNSFALIRVGMVLRRGKA